MSHERVRCFSPITVCGRRNISQETQIFHRKTAGNSRIQKHPKKLVPSWGNFAIVQDPENLFCNRLVWGPVEIAGNALRIPAEEARNIPEQDKTQNEQNAYEKEQKVL